ncbi:hypothetical protein M3Y94_00826200 [Aphelenchoides besseyi]|nr:hypothetical protein M3Y94_00826200 [Aphelenchoides besseyi]KAI6227065.1 hypothetical protein M3Y95_00687400 [Aphelenchoides besseyi]
MNPLVITFALLVIRSAEGCAPAGGGSSTATPTFKLSFYTPVQWTFSDNPEKTAPGQLTSAEEARQAVTGNINSAIAEAVKQVGYESLLSAAVYNIGGYDASTPFPIGNEPGDYIVESGIITKQIEDDEASASTAEPTNDTDEVVLIVDSNLSTKSAAQEIEIKVTNSPILLSRNQWKTLADDIYVILSTKYNVRLVKAIKVSV